MRKCIALPIVLFAALLLGACAQLVRPPEVSEKVAVNIDEKTSTLLQKVGDAIASGNRSQLDAYLAEEDPSGSLRGIVDANTVVRTTSAVPRLVFPGAKLVSPGPLPDGWPDLDDGDIVLLGQAPAGNVEATLLSYAFNFAYGHAAIIEKIGTGPDAQYIAISATIDSNGAGVCYQSLSDLANGAMSFARVRPPKDGLGATWSSDFYGRFNLGDTAYSFLLPNLDPVPRDVSSLTGRYLWYCTKVTWRIFDAAGTDTEYPGYYFGSSNGWEKQRATLLYQIYSYYYWNILNSFWRRFVDSPDKKLQKVLAGLVTPDEVRAKFSGNAVEVWSNPSAPGSAEVTEAMWSALGDAPPES